MWVFNGNPTPSVSFGSNNGHLFVQMSKVDCVIVLVTKCDYLLEDRSSPASLAFSLDSEKNNIMKCRWEDVHSEIKNNCD